MTDGAYELWSVRLDNTATRVRLSDVLSPGQYVRFAISPDSARVVYLVDQDFLGNARALQRSDRWPAGAWTKLNMDLAPTGGHVLDFLISPTSERVYYLVDGEVFSVFELYRVDIDGGASTRLNARHHQLLRHCRIWSRADRGRLGAGGLSRRPIDGWRRMSSGVFRRPARGRRRSRSAAPWSPVVPSTPILPDQPGRHPRGLQGRRDGRRKRTICTACRSAEAPRPISTETRGAPRCRVGLPDQRRTAARWSIAPTRGRTTSSSSTACR